MQARTQALEVFYNEEMKVLNLKSAISGVLCCATLVSISSAQNQVWITQFGSSGGDDPQAAASDGVGGVYTAGLTFGSLGGTYAGNRDAWIAHHNDSGDLSWVRQLGTNQWDTAFAAAPDTVGGVYVTGYTFGSLGGPTAGSLDPWLARYDSAGNQTWIRQFGSEARDAAYALASDGSGGVFVGGQTNGNLAAPNRGNYDVWIAHYDSAGDQAWILQFGSSYLDTVHGMTPDGSGGVFVCGDTHGTLGARDFGNFDAWLARYDSAGNRVWIKQLGTNSYDHAYSVSSDGSGGVFVGGYTGGNFGGSNAGWADGWIAHYGSAGDQSWLAQLGSDSTDHAFAVTADGAGGAYLCGRTTGSLGGPNFGSWDAWLAHFGSTGNHSWTRQVGTASGEYLTAAASDMAGGVYVTGRTGGDLGGPNFGGSDSWLARYREGPPLVRYCSPAVVNSTIYPAGLSASGSNEVSADDLSLLASQMPHNTFGYFLTSQTQGFVTGFSGSQGNLCLGGAMGRFNSAGQVKNSGATGSFTLPVQLTSMPQPLGSVVVQPGETWNFQAWYRDWNPSNTSNLTDAIAITFQ
jgi:hypothetical protein